MNNYQIVRIFLQYKKPNSLQSITTFQTMQNIDSYTYHPKYDQLPMRQYYQRNVVQTTPQFDTHIQRSLLVTFSTIRVKATAKPIIYIHDFGIELEDGVTDVWYFEHEALDKKYWYI